MAVINFVAGAGDSQHQVVVVHGKDGLIETADAIENALWKRKSGKDVRENKGIRELSYAAPDRIVFQLALNLMPGAARVKHRSFAVDQSRVGGKQPVVWLRLKIFYAFFGVMRPQQVIAVKERVQPPGSHFNSRV